MRRLVGYDLTGWRDFAARNWLEKPGHEPIEDSEQIVSGGVGGVVVRLGKSDGQRHDLMGGIQALRAPHGLGEGWGPIGSVEKRERVTDLLIEPTRYAPEVAAALRALANPQNADHLLTTTAVLAIPDTADFEQEQEGLLEALRQLGVSSDSLLIWRPVLVCLAAVERGICDGIDWVGVVGHDASGLTSQLLQMREVRGQRAPERRESGLTHAWKAGLGALFQGARDTIVTASDSHAGSEHLTWARCIVPLALGESPSPEVLRHANGSWETIRPPAPQASGLPPVPPSLMEHLSACEIVLVDTPTIGSVRDALIAALSSAVPVPLAPLDHHDVARGGLVAAGKIVRGEPVYFDFLPQISTIVQDATSARSYELVQNDKPLPAGRIYRSAKPAQLGIPAGMEQVKVYLRKEAVDECRLAVVPLPAAADRDATVNLHIEQTPAAGRARLTLASDIFPTSRTVNWETALPQDKSWEALIESLQPTLPSVPNRQILPCGLEVWHGEGRWSGLTSTLIGAAASDRIRWNRLAGLMSARPSGRYAVSSDGDLPEGLAHDAIMALRVVTKVAEAHVRDRLKGRVDDDNDSLRFLTWQFRRCPTWIVPCLLDALESRTGRHAFVRHAASRQLVYQALGRVVTEPDDLRKVFDHLLARDATDWKRDQLASAAQLLARTDAPVRLDRGEIDTLGEVVIHANRRAIGGNYQSSFFYTPYVLVGLLRSRNRDPFALVVGTDFLADRLLKSTQAVIADMRRRFAGDDRVSRFRGVLKECCKGLRGQGLRPDILVEIDELLTGG